MNDPDTAAPEVGAELPGLHVSQGVDGRGLLRLIAGERSRLVKTYPTPADAYRVLRSDTGREIDRKISLMPMDRLEALLGLNVIPFPRPDLNNSRVI